MLVSPWDMVGEARQAWLVVLYQKQTNVRKQLICPKYSSSGLVLSFYILSERFSHKLVPQEK